MNKYFFPADILLPKSNLEKWSVIACDQYTSEPEYWKETESAVSGFESALNVILPEVYLEENNAKKIEAINKKMSEYLDSDVFNCYENTYILTLRTLKNGKLRQGLIGLIDLEEYSYEKGAHTLTRATEQTVIERIPPRVAIRRDALIEIPHIMLLIDDPEKTVIEPLCKMTDSFNKIYDFNLIQNAGSVKGYVLSNEAVNHLDTAISHLAQKNSDGMLFAVGDGNHSLASAKECYKCGCGSRYALVEVVNIHDASLEFEPIYRVLFGAQPETVIESFINAMGGECISPDARKYSFVYGECEKTVSINPKSKLAVADLQAFLDEYIKSNPQVKIDYIHGVENVKKLCQQKNTIGFLFDGMKKDELFTAVSVDGSLPRKTFSMGCADDKRFYLEARKIK